MAQREEFDALVIGAGTRGLVTAYVLSQLGYKAALVDKAPQIGSGDGSFQATDGTWFDFGMHVLDEMRSPLATRLFTHVLEGRVRRTKLKRGIVLRECLIPYAAEPRELPAELRSLLPGDDLVDDIGDDLPTRERLARHYGAGFADLIFDEVLPSYPSESRHLQFGVDEADLLVNIYPWFFPRACRTPKRADSSRAFHDKLRAGIDQHVLYPLEGGFGEFGRALVRKCDPRLIEVITGMRDIEIALKPGGRDIDCIRGGGRCLSADTYFWASSWPELCRLLGIECQNPSTDRIVLGSFRLDRPVPTDFHEILVGTPEHLINRIHFPGAFRGTDEALMQIEFAFPVADDRPLMPEFWQSAWVESTKALGILSAEHRVELFDFKTRTLHFNGYGMEGVRLTDADASQVDPTSNIHPVVPSMANLNLNDHLPRDVAYVASVLARDGP
jgi:NAD(P)-binding Rossmann-like domain